MTPAERREGMVRMIRSFAVMCTHREAMDVVRKFEADHAHELAERIRAEADAANIPGSPATLSVIYGMREAADLIDPETT